MCRIEWYFVLMSDRYKDVAQHWCLTTFVVPSIMSKRKVQDAHLPVGECITEVSIIQYLSTFQSYSHTWVLPRSNTLIMCHCDDLTRLNLQVQKILRERLCHQRLPDKPEGVEAQHRYVYLRLKIKMLLKSFYILQILTSKKLVDYWNSCRYWILAIHRFWN